MIFSVDDIKRDVRIALDQNNSSTPLLDTGDIDTLTLEEIIESKIEDAARVVTRDAAHYLLDGGKAFGESVRWDVREGYGSGSILLPDDFLRLVSFQMSDWSYPVLNAITEDNPIYALQHSRYGGVRGNPQKPIVALSQQPIGLVLEFFSCAAGENTFVKRATYMPIPKITDGEITISEKLKPAVVYYTAHLAALSIGNGDLAATLLNTSKELMQ
jgi:hypothetical protein